MKMPAGHISQQRFQGALKRISKSGTYSSAIKRSFNTVAGGKYRDLKYRTKIDRQRATAFIDDYKKESGLASYNKESSERTFNRAMATEKKESQQQKVQSNRARQRMDKIRDDISGWRKQGEQKQGMSLADMRKKFAAASTGVGAGQPVAAKPGGINAKFVPRSGAALSSLPRLSRPRSPESLETNPRGLSEMRPAKSASAKEEAKPAAEKPAPTETKSDSSGGTDDMMLD